MDFHLLNLRTGETRPLHPPRTLIGIAEHATFRTEAGPYLAALAARYPGGWAFRGLSDDPGVRYNREPLRLGRMVVPKKGDLLVIGEERFNVLYPHTPAAAAPAAAPEPPTCRAYIRDPDGTEECRVVDHDLLFGRLSVCHVRFRDARLSRLSALLAAHGGGWFVHALAAKPIGRNRQPVDAFARLVDGDELQIGPLLVRLEIGDDAPATTAPGRARPAHADPARPADPNDSAEHTTDAIDTSETADPDIPPPDFTRLRTAGAKLDQWLKAHPPAEPAAGPRGGISGWLGAQREKLRGFWLDVPETSAARSLRAAGKIDEAFAILDRAIRARPDSPTLLRELFRLYEAAGQAELCYRPLRQIEKLAELRGRPDPWVLESLARLCQQLGPARPAMFERAIAYWHKAEAASGVSYARERAAAMARRALWEGGYAGTAGGDADEST